MDKNQLKLQLTNYTEEVASTVVKTNFDILADIVAALLNVKKRGGKVFTAGNGGSGATASHMANDFTKGARAHNRVGFNIECLVDSIAVVTCLANDFSYEDVFSIQLETKAKRGDVLVVFSGSGNSPNIVKGVQRANEMGLTTIGFSGRDGGKLAGLCSYLLIAPTDSMEQLEDMHMLYEHAMVSIVHSYLEDDWGVELANYPKLTQKPTFALFDFDGTLSTIREGWQEIMIPYFIDVLSATPKAESRQQLEEVVTHFVDTLTGKQTIFQCIQLAEEIVKRGGKPEEPLVYKKEYLRRLEEHIADRIEKLEHGGTPEEYLLPGSIELLQGLKDRGITCYLASGTDEEDVLREAKLLQVDSYFDGGIFGAQDYMIDCSKEMVINQIMKAHNITGERLVSFGDGYVEIELVHNIGGYTFGVASDEARGKGIHQRKRLRLLEAGADAIIPNFVEADKILDIILKED